MIYHASISNNALNLSNQQILPNEDRPGPLAPTTFVPSIPGMQPLFHLRRAAWADSWILARDVGFDLDRRQRRIPFGGTWAMTYCNSSSDTIKDDLLVTGYVRYDIVLNDKGRLTDVAVDLETRQ